MDYSYSIETLNFSVAALCLDFKIGVAIFVQYHLMFAYLHFICSTVSVKYIPHGELWLNDTIDDKHNEVHFSLAI